MNSVMVSFNTTVLW